MPVKLAQELNSRQCADLVKALDEISDLNLLNYENDFRGDTYMYITERTKDKKVLNSILDVIGKQQEKEDQVKSDLVKQNYYDLIATLYTRLGRKDKAVDARKKYEQLEEEKKAAMRKLFGADKDKK